VTIVRHLDGIQRIEPTAAVTTTASGLRVTYTYSNIAGIPMDLASVRLPTVDLGSRIVVQDFREIGGDLSLDAGRVWCGAYPQSLYSPVAVTRNDRDAIGVSIEYPLMEYQHEICLTVKSDGPTGWYVELGMENAEVADGRGYLFNRPTLAPGETRRYTVNIASAESTHWIETLAPYRDYFQTTYGAVRYTRDNRAVAGISLAYGEFQTTNNRDGWIPECGRPDLNGFTAAANFIAQRFMSSDRVMVWAATGLTFPQSMNFPFQFASRWTNGSPASSAPLATAPAALQQVAGVAGRSLGLWWGHSVNPTTQWLYGSARPLGVGDPTSFELCCRELDAACEAGATQIGLDAFSHSHLPLWSLIPHLNAMRQRQPHLTFCSEGRAPDILHLYAATWVDAYRYTVEPGRDELIPSQRFGIADYLAPGHETWVGMSFDRSLDPTLWGPSQSQVSQEAVIRTVMERGYIPVVWTTANLRALNLAVHGGQ